MYMYVHADSFLLPAEKGDKRSPEVSKGNEYTIGTFTSSRFIVASLAMLTCEHEAVDLSLLLSNGLLGLTQSVVRLSGVCVCVCV